MKHITLFILFGVTISSNILGQTNIYHPFPDSNAIWRETIIIGDQICLQTNDYGIFILGDTTVNDIIYHKLYSSGAITSNCLPNYSPYNNSYCGAIRQSISERKIFYLDIQGNENLLYDFNLFQGDTLQVSFNSEHNFYVSEIDSILIGNDYRKKYILYEIQSTGNCSTPIFLIEGIGSSIGLYNSIICSFEGSVALNCFGQNGQTLYQSLQSSDECNINVGINTEVLQSIPIFSNPIKDSISIFNLLRNESYIFILRNENGCVLMNYSFQNKENYCKNVGIQNLPSGLYFATLISAKHSSHTVKLFAE
jgi:hypothetical protein